jgi:CAF1 family ribonuclease
MKLSSYYDLQFADAGPDISMSSSSISFLRNNKMDFGTWITKGLGYTNQNGEAFLKKKYLDCTPTSTETEATRITLTKDSDMAFLARNKQNLATFIADDSETKFVFEKCNPYLRKVLYQLMEFDHPKLTVIKTSDERLQALKLSEVEKIERQRKIVEDGKVCFAAAMGFRLVFLDMIECKKPMIGHNCLFDFMFMMRWLDSPFKEGKTDTLTDFKIKFNGYFPVVFDTKYIASSSITDGVIMDTSLGELYQNLVASAVNSGVCKLRFASGFDQYYSGGGQFHDAGWDAYCTGALFCYQLSLLPSMEHMKEMTGNKLFMMYSMFHMDLDPSQPNGWLKAKGTLLHLGHFATETKNDAVLQIFTLAGYEMNQLEVMWIDGSSTFVSIDTAELADEIVSKVSLPTGWVLTTYEQFVNGNILDQSLGIVSLPLDSTPEPALKKIRPDSSAKD